jgi:acyl-CoA synthetase (AMP-forming)/AMP-acid ligase II
MKTVADVYERNATHFAERTAYVHDERRVSHSLLLDRIRRLASAIHQTGARRQSRIGIVATNSLEYFELYGACEYAGYIIANYNFRSAVPEVAAVRAGAQGISRYVCIGETPPDWATSYADFIAEGNSSGPPIRAAERDFAHLFYTSGTTGKPKGVPIRQEALLITSQRMSLEEDVSVLQITPAFHVGGRGQGLGAFWNGGKVVIESSFDATRFLQLVHRERINITFMVPPMMQAVLDHPDFQSYDLSSLRWVMAASTKIPVPLLMKAREMIGPCFYTAYGGTETGGVTRMKRSDFQSDGSPSSLKRLESVGQFETPVEGRILDEEGNEVPIGQVGEICVKSYMWSGYWNNHVATLESMHGEFFRTGDLGYIDDRGYVFIVDRKKDMIISGGENIYSREVEDALQLHPAVYETAVIGQADAKWGETVCAVIVLRPGAAVTEEELQVFAQTRIARFKCPRRIIFLDEMPRTGSGKIDKVALRKAYSGGVA